MQKIEASSKIYLGLSKIPYAGRGVFAKQKISAGETIEVCPVIVVPLDDSSNDDDKGLLTSYFFYFGDDLAMVLGFGSLYNHSYEPNASYIKLPDSRTVEFKAIKDILADEEITVSYNNGDPEDKSTPMNRGVLPFQPSKD